MTIAPVSDADRHNRSGSGDQAPASPTDPADPVRQAYLRGLQEAIEALPNGATLGQAFALGRRAQRLVDGVGG